MPDLITHMAFSHVLIRIYEQIRNSPHRSACRVLFYLGTILPDILSRPWYIVFPKLHAVTLAMHTPAGMLLVCLIVALLFETPVRKPVFLYLWAGTWAHFLLDAFQKQLIYNNYWFFPFTWKAVGWGIAGAGTILEWIPVWLACVLVFELSIFIINRKKRIYRSAG
ncbi:hypothetical protein JW948_17995 [bacterium]|nr:hypothetical protein [bacterium]